MTTIGLEAFGLVALEAQAHALPVLYSSVPGLCDVLGDTGLPFDPGDATGLARCLNVLAYDLDTRRRLAREGQRNAIPYSMRALADRVTAITASAMLTARTEPQRQCSTVETHS
jgi:glycosyltransferase involved in cell wall biosynthesis